MASDRLYSQIIGGLKILLPLVAIGSMSTMFLMSKSAPDQTKLPFAQSGLVEKIRDQQLSQPYFSGTMKTGDAISLSAVSIRPDPEVSGRVLAKNVLTTLSEPSGNQVTLAGASGQYTGASSLLELDQGVQIVSQDGYQFSASDLKLNIETLGMSANGPIQGTGPQGIITADRLEVSRKNPQDGFLIVFKGGVKLIYTPQR